MLSSFLDTSSWDYQQWLASIIMVFVIVAVAVLLHRITQIFKLSRKPRYTPNLRPLRRARTVREDNPLSNLKNNVDTTAETCDTETDNQQSDDHDKSN
ncbi:MAG: hypothetical protein HOF74_11635 [Gammaproteobacteria bacterium]|jgi:hypothetical protein|nr:hypothetical protein [Gammaproteobacteria bacterium]MBT3860477.1 hypothetical protein [Gammaproteobacteria bacterium]MBT3987926.1 hypothetical protein [Gammaproteobacteria bacterium]MBT4256563.1 hypothetical protein [Gammaproteobacteria bacterium]MBT4582453.1 hypothetical protein [Gammaproteobacteria bacterium]